MKIAIATSVMVLLYLTDKSMVSSQMLTQSSCESFGAVPMDNFNQNLYDGQWFTSAQYDWPQSVNYDCYLQIRTPRPDGNHNLTELLIKPGVLPDIQMVGVTIFDIPNKGHFLYTNPNHPSIPYYILGTDYFTYSIEFSCQPVSGGNKLYVYVMSRNPVVDPLTQRTIDGILARFHISKTGTWRTLNITSCPAQLLDMAGGPGLLERVLQIVTGLVRGVGTIVGGLLGGVLG